MTRRLLVLLLGMVAALTLAPPALAATSTVTLGQGGPSPSTVTVKAGDTVVFSNTDGTRHTLKSTSRNWTLSAALSPNTKKSVVFGTAGTFDYSDTYSNVLGFSTTSAGHVVVPTSPTPSPTASATSKPSPSASATPSASSSAQPSPSASATQSGVAIPPPITGGVIPTPQVTTSTGPQPQVAGPVPTAGTTTEPSTTPAASVGYADPSTIVQRSPHGFGLPVALAVVAVVGVVTLLVRFLLATPEAERPVR